MYLLIRAGQASKMELEEYYDLDEALKLYALWQMSEDIKAFQADELKRNARR